MNNNPHAGKAVLLASPDKQIAFVIDSLHVIVWSNNIDWRIVEDRWGITGLEDVDFYIEAVYSLYMNGTYELESYNISISEPNSEKRQELEKRFTDRFIVWLLGTFTGFKYESGTTISGIDEVVAEFNKVLNRIQELEKKNRHLLT